MGARAISGAALAVGAVLLASVGVAAATDLHPLLAAAPSADWVEVPAGTPKNLVGDFTAHDYAAYLQALGTHAGTTEFDLNLYGFTRGFALEWTQQGSDLLVERVFEFRQPSGARSWYSLLKLGDRTSSRFSRDIPMPASIPYSSGALLKWPDGFLQAQVGFWKGNLAFVVHGDSDTNDLSAIAVNQAATEYTNAPSQTQVPPGSGQVVSNWIRTVALAGGVVFVALAIVIAVTILLVARRRSPAGPPGGVAPISPDGAYWWDGRAWRPVPGPRPPG